MADALLPNPFRFTLLCKGNRRYVLKHAPKQWMDIETESKRDADYQALVRTLSGPTTWVKDAAKIIRREFSLYKLLTEVTVIIEFFNPTASVFAYEQLSPGRFRLDFSGYNDNDTSVDCPMVTDDISVNIDAYKETDYSIPVNVPEALTVNALPLVLTEEASLVIENNTYYNANAFVGFSVALNELNSVNRSTFSTSGEAVNNPDFSTSSKYTFIAQISGNILVKVKGNIGLRTKGGGKYTLAIFKQDGSQFLTINYTNENAGGFHTYDINPNITFLGKVNKGDRLFVYAKVENPADGTGYSYGAGNALSIELQYSTISPATQYKALRLSYLFNALITKMNLGDAYPVQTGILSDLLYPIVVTCSDAIRKIDVGTLFSPSDTLQPGATYQVLNDKIKYANVMYNVNDMFSYQSGFTTFTSASGNGFVQQTGLTPQIITNWSAFFRSLRGIMGGRLGFGIQNNTAVLEALDYFFDSTKQIADLGDAIKWGGLAPALDYTYNTIKVGYKDQQYTSTNGQQEVNSEQNYSTILKSPTNELDVTCDYRTDPYGIEEIRVRPVDSSASRSDNDVLLIWLENNPQSDGSYNPLRVDGQSYANVDAGYYNWKLTPKHNLLRGGAFLHSIFQGLEGSVLKFESGLKNTDFLINGVAENENLPISSLPAALFSPYVVTISVPGSNSRSKLIAKSPNGYLAFTYRNKPFKGFIIDSSDFTYTKKDTEYTLLLTADVDLRTLVR